ncbi:MAG: hypothetical protein JSV18_03165 [Candidatus Bathyarchaeota archaeon]|nr:MAG: hypothetical protein JSV18_03165 [Candidatus Bathyarchaeota archaeon]
MGVYIGAKWARNIAFSCGQDSFRTAKRGLVGKDLTLEEGYEVARETALNCRSSRSTWAPWTG